MGFFEAGSEETVGVRGRLCYFIPAILVREGLSGKVTFEQKFEGSKGEPSWVKSYPFLNDPSQIYLP